MSMKMFAMTCGSITGRLKDMIEGEEGPVQLPIPSYLIEHAKGTVLFDTGMHPQLQTDAAGRLGERVVRIFSFDTFRPGDEVSKRLEAIDRDPAKIHYIVNSHLHFDHCGGNQLIPNATVVVQRREWAAAQAPEIAAKVGIYRQDIDHGHKLLLVDGEHDLFGDGRIVCLPTHGHTPGHQSLKVRLDTGDIVLTGDACYFCRTLRERRLPRFVYDRDAMLASLDRLAALERGGARIFVGHDPDFWKSVPQAPAAIL
jgi:glyoxylase-like metal-dependent hydrolase (beta-lactamase superfamily II)